MASRQEQRSEGEAQAKRAGEHIARAEAHAREAAREIAHERTERARVVGGGGQEQAEERRRGGILETVQQGARSLVSAVGRTLGVTKDKASQAADATAHKASETTEKVKQSTEGFGEAMEEGTARSPHPEEKLDEYKQSAADAARKAMEYLTLRTEEQTGGANKATEEVARQEVEATRERTQQVAEAERQAK